MASQNIMTVDAPLLVRIAAPSTKADSGSGRRTAPRWLALVAAIVTVALAGCGVQSRMGADSGAGTMDLPYAPREGAGYNSSQGMDYDPWNGFNERTFYLNHDVLDRYAIKPLATAWNAILPVAVVEGLDNAFDNLGMPGRLANNLLQGRFAGAAREIVRSALNSTIGLAGSIDVAGRLGVEKSSADTGQTLGVYGIAPGPYLVLPLLPPLTVRDAIGYGADSLMDPLSFFTPIIASVGRTAASTINGRADKLELFNGVEDSAIDLYAAVRNGYLQRRRKSIEQALEDRASQWQDGSPPQESLLRQPPALQDEQER